MTRRGLQVARAYAAEIILGAALLLFALLRTYGLHFVRADEHMYHYMSLLVLEGHWPYRDFFLSHPPLHVYLMAAVFAVTGYSLVVAKWVTTADAAVAAVLVLQIGKRLFGKPEGLCAALAFLVTPQVLDGSADLTGANFAILLLVAGTYCAIRARHLGAGALLALGSLSGLYVAPMAAMLTVLLLLRSRRAALRLVAGFAGTVAVLCLPFLLVAGDAFLYQVVTYNLLKQPHSTTWLTSFHTFFFFNSWPMWGFVSALALSGLRWAVEGRPAAEPAATDGSATFWQRVAWSLNPWRGDYVASTVLLSTTAFGYFAFYASLRVFYSYYFLMVLPLMALLSGYAACDVVRYGWQTLVAGEPRKGKAALGPRLVSLFALVATVVHHGQIRDARLADDKPQVLHFTWYDSPWLGPTINQWVRELFWESERDRREPPGPITRYLQDETGFAATVDRFVAAVQEQCREGDRIFGDYYLAPFAASVSECAVAARLVDTNTHRIRAGESTLQQWLDAAEEDGLSLVVLRYPGWMTRQPEVRDGLRARFAEVVFEWRDPHVGRVELRRSATTDAASHRILDP
jgi:4-amino-4-deoxy-L-arabinose transferase-like glycosyltransferase